ncbi:MAG: UDP-3-O-(3-hydroxymyristoyl)glucosamine N-acyltransferase [Ignavibacteriales bacterium]|nr:UDP-3-O-(3-hydroxymyristoyl)glucosamine N-acyltransferase [Ignavibacteriales bacterium]
MTVEQIATFLDGEVIGDGSVLITGLAKVEEARSGDLAFIANPKYEKYLGVTHASAVIVGKAAAIEGIEKLPPALIRVDDPYTSFVIALEWLNPQPELIAPGIHPTAVIAPSVSLGEQCGIGAHVVIGEGCRIGAQTKILANTVLGSNVTVGDGCLIYPNVTIREECIIGSRVVLQPGVVIGSDGFGFAPKKDGTYRKIPQRGIVVVEDDVEIQANTCIDRATMGETRIRRGTKLDNLVQIAHNVVVGEDTVIAAQSGIAGSTKIGKHVVIAGNVGIVGHLSIADRVVIAGQSGIAKSITKEGETYFGYPAKEMSRARRIEGALRQLPEVLVEIRRMEQEIQRLKDAVEQLNKKEE